MALEVEQKTEKSSFTESQRTVMTGDESKITITFTDLSVTQTYHAKNGHDTVLTFPSNYAKGTLNQLFKRGEKRSNVLRHLDGILQSGEILLVLGKPGSGTSEFLQTLARHTDDLEITDKTAISYDGTRFEERSRDLHGEAVYHPDIDVHFPSLTVQETVQFAARSRFSFRDSNEAIQQASRSVCSKLGLTGALDTKIGNAVIPGVSGGERRRAGIAEVLVGDSILQCWDQSTRGLDSGNAANFVKALRQSTTENQSLAAVSLYQVSEETYELFDKVLVLEEGQQIYFGPAQAAKSYFTNLGFVCPHAASTVDFLTSITNPTHSEEHTGDRRIPRTADDLARAWKTSSARNSLISEIKDYRNTRSEKKVQKRHAVGTNHHTGYSASITSQIILCTQRGFRRLVNDLNPPVSALVGNAIISIILGSMFYNMKADTGSFFGRGVLLFIVSLLNFSLPAFESVAVWDVRPIIEKHRRYAFYRPASEAVAAIICDLPNKFLSALVFNLPLYFMSNLERTASAFFTFFLFCIAILLTGSMIYRCMGSMSRTLEGSQPAGAVFALLVAVYSGFVVPFDGMRPWLKWFAYINPVYYTFESLAINEFSGKTFSCVEYVPQGSSYSSVGGSERSCSAVGARSGSNEVLGDDHIAQNWDFQKEHLWRNLGIIFALMIFYGTLHVLYTEFLPQSPKKMAPSITRHAVSDMKMNEDEESQPVSLTSTRSSTLKPTSEKSNDTLDGKGATFLWDNIGYSIKEKKNTKKILEGVQGWVKPGTMTALMGASGAGKTTLLNILADRVSTGVISGKKLRETQYSESFAQSIGYAQQEDLHLSTATVREALQFSALLRQPARYSKSERLAYVEQILDHLDIESDGFADAIIGTPGDGLTVEQRKRTTIGVELAARPEILIFLDEPTSGLDGDSAMRICKLLRKLADHGQAIMCVIHQPSALLLQTFDRLLFLSGGRSIYFGEIESNLTNLVDYFERHGARMRNAKENPADWMMDVTSRRDDSEHAWAEAWIKSPEYQDVQAELETLKRSLVKGTEFSIQSSQQETQEKISLWYQIKLVSKRSFVHDWRSPTYVWSKFFSTLGVAFFNGISFWQSGNTAQDVQNQIFSLFLLTTLFGAHIQLIMKRFHSARVLYDQGERQSRTYSWIAFLFSNVFTELVSQTLVSVLAFVCWYYPLGLWNNAKMNGQLNDRAGLTFLFLWSLMLLFQTISQMLMVIMPDVATGLNIANLLFMLSFIFAGVLVPPNALNRFWIFMYRATPLSYYMSGIMSTGLSGMSISCTANDLVTIPSVPSNITCGMYLESYLKSSGANLLNADAITDCRVCPYGESDVLLDYFGMHYENRWWNWGVTMAYNSINLGLAALFCWLLYRSKSKNSDSSSDGHVEEAS